MVKVIDNFIEDSFVIQYFHKYLLEFVPHSYGEYSSTTDQEVSRFYTTEFNEKDYFPMLFVNKMMASQSLGDWKIDRVHSNIQHQNMGGGFHYDFSDKTLLLMVSETTNDHGFEFVEENGKVVNIPFVQNRMICFEGKTLYHRGVAPSIQQPRVTFAVKIMSPDIKTSK